MKTFVGYLFVISFLICAASIAPSSAASDDGQMKVVCYCKYRQWTFDKFNSSQIKSIYFFKLKKKIVSNWAFYRLQHGRYEPDHIDPKLCTHIVYAFFILDPESMKMKSYEYRIDFGYQSLRRIAENRQHGIKALVAVGGFEDSFSDKYGRLLSNANNRRTFVESVVEFIRKNNFDGLELDLEVWVLHSYQPNLLFPPN